ncbi:beta-glucoside operon transcriptional antiterminator [Bacillus niacini]|uniref:Beta-glucoside operon transcriptional antiterminator n=1 Tax=Neobacillus niacini TaxID=86668 RepID=A0A852TNV7_9BACI|nr:PRD domain-containing protein [Neobacillus niacini]NYE08778.1 beta-glucoside operon transcriptional antiterminator [Neobacillus niacini]
MKIKKILNNNAVVVLDNNEEKIAIGAGIAFEKRKNDIINPNKIEKLFVMKENEKFQQLLQQIPEKHFSISEDIISYAEENLGLKLSEHIHIGLTDHLSFAIERATEGIHLKNKLFDEIKILYKKEFDIGMWAIRHIEKMSEVKMPVDEAAYIALHIHTSKPQSSDMKQTLRQTAIIGEMIQTIKNTLNISIEEDDLSYQRLMTHLRFTLSRVNDESLPIMDDEMLMMLKKKFALSYNVAQKVAQLLVRNHGITLPEQELGYITIHIERIRNR